MEVKVNGEYIELGDSSPAITKKSIDIDNPSARFLDYTNKFQVPYTNKNARIFKSPLSVGSNNSALDELFDVEIEDVFRIFAGKGYLDSTTSEKFNLQVVDNSKELFKYLDKSLNKISWDDKDLLLTTATIDANDSADITSCWIWNKLCLHENAIIDNTDLTSGDARCKYSRPSFYVQGFLKRAIELYGHTYTATDIDLAFSSCHSAFYFTNYQKTIAETYAVSGELNITELNINDFIHASISATDTNINVGATKTKFRLRGTINSDTTATIIFKATDNSDITKISESKIIIASGSQYIDFTSSEFFSAAGMTVDVKIACTGNVVINAYLYTLVSDKDLDLSTNPFLGYKIKAYDNLPEITYLDLFKLICVVGNKFQKINTYTKAFEFGTLAQLNKLKAANWSDKFIIGSETITSIFKGLFKKNWLKYKNDVTVNPELGWSSFETNNESLEAEGDYFDLKFGASVDVSIAGNDFAQMKIYNNTTRIVDQIPNIRLFSVQGSELKFAPLAWSNLSTNYYHNFFNSLRRVRQINAEFILSKLDVMGWSEDQLVYVDFFKTTFIVLEIPNFIPGKKTKVKLLAYGH